MSKSVKIVNSALFKEIRGLILSARNTVVRNIDTIQVVANFEIGRRIVEQEQKGENRAEYGKTLIKELASKLTIEFGSGFSQYRKSHCRRRFSWA